MRTVFSKRSSRRTGSGFSLIEVVIAVGILAFGLLTLALLQVHALTQGSMGRHTGDAAAIGRSFIEQVNRLPWATLTADLDSGWQTPGWAGVPNDENQVSTPGGGVATEHAYTVDWRVTTVAGTACLRDVELRVSWQEEKHSQNKALVLATRRYDTGGSSC